MDERSDIEYMWYSNDNWRSFRVFLGGYILSVLPSQGKLLYHITRIDNLPSILESGLMPRRLLRESEISFCDIADPEIISKREAYKTDLSKFVLFHFFVRNPFDCAVCHNFGAENMAIIAIGRNTSMVRNSKIIPTHPLDVAEPDIYPYDEGLQLIEWDILDMQEGRDYSDPEIRKACMAECLISRIVRPREFEYVYVKDAVAERRVRGMEGSDGIRIVVNPRMFPGA